MFVVEAVWITLSTIVYLVSAERDTPTHWLVTGLYKFNIGKKFTGPDRPSGPYSQTFGSPLDYDFFGWMFFTFFPAFVIMGMFAIAILGSKIWKSK